MAYIPNPAWSSGTTISVACLQNLETIYTEGYSYFTAHTHDALYPTKTEMESTFWYGGNDGAGSGSDADLIYKASGNLHASSFVNLGVPTGLIILWYGSVGSIPSGWALCSGSGGTVDLRGRFVPGAGNTYNPGVTGGSATFLATGTLTVDAHVLTVAEMALHSHPYTDRTPNASYIVTDYGSSMCASIPTTSGATASAGSGSGHGHSAGEGTSFAGNAVASLPYYYALCYIQKTV